VIRQYSMSPGCFSVAWSSGRRLMNRTDAGICLEMARRTVSITPHYLDRYQREKSDYFFSAILTDSRTGFKSVFCDVNREMLIGWLQSRGEVADGRKASSFVPMLLDAIDTHTPPGKTFRMAGPNVEACKVRAL